MFALPDAVSQKQASANFTLTGTHSAPNRYALRELSQMGGQALDELVSELIAGRPHVPHAFLDWMGSDASLIVMMSLENLHTMPRFQASLQLSDDPMPAMRRWVRHWVGPQLVARFHMMADALPEFQSSLPQPLDASDIARVN